ncbi:MAG: hypothetical protein ABEJ75_03565 [Candidatus Nanohaloarchaea archaeon]
MEFECTREEFEAMQSHFFPGDSKGKELDQDALTLVLVVLGVKRGGVVHDHGTENFEEALRESGLYYRTPPTEVEREFPLEGFEYLISREKQRLEMVEESYSDRSGFRRHLGLFCGYPSEDVEWYVQEGNGEWVDWREKPELKEIATFAFYRPKPQEENLERARERMERNRQALKEMDERFGTDLGDRLLKSLESTL